MAKRRVVYVISESRDRVIGFEWIADSSIGRDFELSFVLLNDAPGTPLQRGLEATGCPVHLVPFTRKQGIPLATWRLASLFRHVKPHVVHTHLTVANLTGLSAALLTGVPTRIYTRHHATINHAHHKHAVLYDKASNRLATQVVATCENGRQILREMEGLDDHKIRLINFGFRLDRFREVDPARIEALCRKHEINSRRPVIGVVSKCIEWKGIQHVIPAFERILARFPNALLVLANARPSSYTPELDKLLSGLPAGSYRRIVFEEDAPALFKTFDVFVHAPVDPQVEAFGLVYVEALAAGIPSVFTLSGIAREFVQDSRNALTVPFKDSEAIAAAVLRLLDEPALANGLKERALRDVAERFDFERMVWKLSELYST